jgi:hypothetical protein
MGVFTSDGVVVGQVAGIAGGVLVGRRTGITGTVAAGAAAPSEIEVLRDLDEAYLGQPFVEGHVSGSNIQTMDVAYLGQPFVRYRKTA